MIKKKGKILSTTAYFVSFSILLPAYLFFIGYSIEKLIGSIAIPPILALKLVGFLFIGIGLWFVNYATLLLWKKGKGLPVSSLPPEQFVNSGIYQFCRHPIYSGAVLIFGGFSLLSHTFWNIFLSCPLFFLFFLFYVLCVEEPVLLKRFGQNYIQYKNQVPLFFPLPFGGIIKKSLSSLFDWLSVKVNHPLIIRYKQHIFFLGYGFWCGLGILFGLTVLNILLIWFQIKSAHIEILLITVTFCCLFGIRLIWLAGSLVYTKNDMKTSMEHVGFVSWGVLVGNLLSGIVFYRLTGRSLFLWLDCIFLSQMITHFFGRLGCLFYGCCYGKETNSRLCIKYSHPALKAVRENLVNSSHIFPVQLFSAGYGLFVFLFIFITWLIKPLPAGSPFILTCLLYAIFRFLEEMCRTQKKLIWNLFSPAQIFCFFILLICAGGLFYQKSAMVVEHYPPLGTFLNAHALPGLEIPILLILGLISVYVFSYHRKEIGKWA